MYIFVGVCVVITTNAHGIRVGWYHLSVMIFPREPPQTEIPRHPSTATGGALKKVLLTTFNITLNISMSSYCCSVYCKFLTLAARLWLELPWL